MNKFNLLAMQSDILGETTLELPFLVGYSIISLLVSIAFFVIKGIAIYTMAKRRNFDKLWMSFVPFLNYIVLGKLAGKAIVWGKEIKNIGLVVCILSAVTLIGGYLLDVGYYLSLIEGLYNVKFVFNSAFINSWVSQTGVVFVICHYLYLGIDLINLFLTICLALLIFRKYYPERAFLYMILSIFFDFMFGILLFTVRNREYLTYEDFLRSRQNYYNQNNPYGSNNGYTVYNGGGNNVNADDDPFPEFSNKKQENEPFAEFNGEKSNSTNSESKNNSNEDDLFN